MHIEARFRRRANESEVVSELNDSILSGLSGIRGLWNHSKSIHDAFIDLGTGESASVNISACLNKSIQGAVSYASRVPASIVDKSISDDTLNFHFDSNDLDLEVFSSTLFPGIIKAFSAYRAAIVTDLDQDLDDFEEIVRESRLTGKDIDGRDSIFRFYPVNYYDDLLCRREFGISAGDVVSLVRKSTEHSEVLEDGALLVVSFELLQGTSLNKMNEELRHLLNKKNNRGQSNISSR